MKGNGNVLFFSSSGFFFKVGTQREGEAHIEEETMSEPGDVAHEGAN